MTDTTTPTWALTHTLEIEVPMGISILPGSPPRTLMLEVRDVWDLHKLANDIMHVAEKLISL